MSANIIPCYASAEIETPSAFYDIPPQSLSAAVEAFALKSGVQVLYDRPPDATRRSGGVHGLLTPKAALQILLKGTGLTARFTDASDAVLAPTDGSAPPSPIAASPPPDLPRLALSPLRVKGDVVLEARSLGGGDPRLYAHLIQIGLQQALAANPKTARGDYSAELDLRIGPDGQILRAEMAKSSGVTSRDADILATVKGLILEAPPPSDLPQPIRVALRSRRPS